MITLYLKAVYDDVAESLKGFVPPNCSFIQASNGYTRCSIDGNTIIFFTPIQSCGMYHIVICNINENILKEWGMTYDELRKKEYESLLDLVFY